MSKLLNIAMTSNTFPYGKGIAYGGERIIGYLIEGLLKLGHNVYAFARKGTVPPEGTNDFVPVDNYDNTDDPYYHAVKEYSDRNNLQFDIYHCFYFGEKWNPNVTTIAKASLETVWNRWCHREPFFHKKPEAPNIISYSTVLQDDLMVTNTKSTMIHYGIPKDLYTWSPIHDDYAVFIGKLEGGKNPGTAIRLAKAAGIKIVIIGPPYNTGTFWNEVCPHIDNEKVFWVRGASDEQKQKIMSKAKCFISSNDSTWKEHAGIVNMEALAMGIPIIAFNKVNQNSAIFQDKFIEDGKHGFFLNYNGTGRDEEIIEIGVPLLQKIDTISRYECRLQFEKKFTADLMAQRYEYYYNYILQNGDVDSIEIPF
jgi:glycosyltransferase involved in cell wall biosynthesis